MTEAPKNIWLRWGRKVSLLPGQISIKADGDIPYIRADIVDELVAALKWIDVVNAMEYEYRKVARDALAKLEESHD